MLASRTQPPWHCLALALCLAFGCSKLVDVQELEDGKCSPGTKACYDSSGVGYCEVTNSTNLGCGLPGCYPCVVPNARATCGDDGHCSFNECITGFDNCDERDFNGCEVNLSNDVLHCDRCYQECDLDHATAACSARKCVVESCEAGYRDCNGAAEDGCEVSIGTDDDCSACGDKCDAGYRCERYQCAAATG